MEGLLAAGGLHSIEDLGSPDDLDDVLLGEVPIRDIREGLLEARGEVLGSGWKVNLRAGLRVNASAERGRDQYKRD